jgi:hypothetical protein
MRHGRVPLVKRTRTSRRRTWIVLSIALFGCRGAARDVPLAEAAQIAATAGSSATTSSSPSDAASLFAVDETGPSVRDRRIDVTSIDAAEKLEEIASRATQGGGVVPVRASRGALVRWLTVLVRALGRTGVEEVDVVTPTLQGDVRAPLRLSPLGQVPMHEARCGARITFQSDGTGAVRYMEKTVAKLSAGAEGPDLSRTLSGMRARMKGCSSTLWMLAADQDAKWGPAFDAATTVSASELAEGTTRYIMLL